MAVISPISNTSLSTASGFYRAEAYNIGMFSTTDLALTSTRTINVTFANAGTLQKVFIALRPNTATADASTFKDVTVTLKESGVTRASVTLTGDQIMNNLNYDTNTLESPYAEGWVKAFSGFAYAVDTVAAKWTLEVTQSVSGTNTWHVRTSDGTNLFYVACCDNAVTFSSGNDCIVADYEVEIDMTATFKGYLGTGDTTRGVCAIAASHSSGGANCSRFVWENPPASAYTLTLDGYMVIAAHGGFRVGTSASPIPVAQKATITFGSASVGTSTNVGFQVPDPNSGTAEGKGNIFLYGEVPTYGATNLAADVAVGANTLTTTDSTGWAINDIIMIGGMNSNSSRDNTFYTITAISGTSITFTPVLATVARKAGYSVIRQNGYGVKLQHTAGSLGSTTAQNIAGFSNVQFSGVEMSRIYITGSGNAGVNSWISGDSVANRSRWFFRDCTHYASDNYQPVMFALYCSPEGIEFTRCYCYRTQLHNGLTSVASSYQQGLTMDACRVIYVPTFQTMVTMPFAPNSITNCYFESWVGGNSAFIVLQGANITFNDNKFFQSAGNQYGLCGVNGLFNSTFYRNKFDGAPFVAIGCRGSATGVKWVDSEFGQTVSNVNDFNIETGQYVNMIFESSAGTFNPVTSALGNWAAGSAVYVADDNNSANVDKAWLRRGYFQRCGSGLSDTTVRTAGGYSMRLQPTSGTDPLNWPNLVAERAVPTGNIQNKTMTVSCWVYINNTAYDAGTYQLPRLNVKYDNATTTYAQATATFGSWQQLAVTITPTTTFGQIEVWLSAATDAAGSNAYVYVDDFNVAYPAGVQVSLGALDLWANGTPVWPPIATFPALGGIWDEAMSAHTVSGSYGAKVKKLLELGQFVGLK